jgi:predicted ribosomally synthesized peptide with SipW-like signal peptide
MINQKIALSALSIVTALVLTGGATYAFFTDTATSNGNTFTSGTLSLLVRDDDQTFAPAVTQSIHSPTNWAPGQSFQSFVCFKNDGSVDIQEILFSLNSSGSNADFREAIIAETVELGFVTETECLTPETGTLGNFTSDFVTRFDGTDTNSTVSLAELLADVDGTDRVEDDLLNRPEAKLTAGQFLKFRTTWRFATDSNPTMTQGQALNLDILYTARQEEIDEDNPTIPVL